MGVVLGVVRRRHADAISHLRRLGQTGCGGLVVLVRLEAVDISGVQHAGMHHVLVQHAGLVVAVLGVVRRRHADAISHLRKLGRTERGGVVVLGLEAVDISGVQHAGMHHVLVQHGIVGVVLEVVRRRHADAISHVPTIRQPGCVGLILLGLEAVDITVVQYGELLSHSPSFSTITIVSIIRRHRSGGGHRWCRGWRSRSDWCRVLNHAALPCPWWFDKCEYRY